MTRSLFVPEIDLDCARELYDGMAIVISQNRGISEFIEYVLRGLAPDGAPQVREAVKTAHTRLGLSQ